jgi:integrase
MPRKTVLPTGVFKTHATGLHIRWPGPPDAEGEPTTRAKTLVGIWDPSEAKLIRDRYIGNVTALVARGSASMTVCDLNAAWKGVRFKDFDGNTIEGYEWIFKKIEETRVEVVRGKKRVSMKLGEVRLIDLDRPVLAQWLDYLIVSGREGGRGPLSGASIRKVHGLFSEILGWGVERGWLAFNPALGQKLPSADPKGARALTTRELRDLVAHVLDPVMRALVITMWAVGLRPGEVLGLSIPDVLLESRLLLARRQRTGRGAKRLKDKDPRAVAMPDTLTRTLARYIPGLTKRAEEFGDEYRWDLMLLFPRADGNRITVQQLRYAVHQAGRKAGLGVVNPKDARTTWATMSDADLVDEDEVEAVAANLGHDSTATTKRHYIRPIEAPVPKPKKRERVVADRMDRRLRNVVGGTEPDDREPDEIDPDEIDPDGTDPDGTEPSGPPPAGGSRHRPRPPGPSARGASVQSPSGWD